MYYVEHGQNSRGGDSDLKAIGPGAELFQLVTNMAQERTKKATATNPFFSLVPGATAGAVEGFATYPIEFTKTMAQFSTKAGEKVCGQERLP